MLNAAHVISPTVLCRELIAITLDRVIYPIAGTRDIRLDFAPPGRIAVGIDASFHCDGAGTDETGYVDRAAEVKSIVMGDRMVQIGVT